MTAMREDRYTLHHRLPRKAADKKKPRLTPGRCCYIMSDRPKHTTQVQRDAKPASPVFSAQKPTAVFMSDQEWQEYQRQHEPEGHERWKKDQEQARLARLREQNYSQWAAAITSDQLRKEWPSLESRRIALERELKPEQIRRAGWPLQGPLGKQYAEVIFHI